MRAAWVGGEEGKARVRARAATHSCGTRKRLRSRSGVERAPRVLERVMITGTRSA